MKANLTEFKGQVDISTIMGGDYQSLSFSHGEQLTGGSTGIPSREQTD